jgi:DNA replication ATP-dependent helicase Dna2
MNQDIMSLCNHLVYDGRLHCGSKTVANSQVQLPRLISLASHIHQTSDGCVGNCWLGHVISPQNSVVFCDTDLVPAVEVKHGPFIENPTEAQIILQIVKSILDSGGAESDIAIICPYRNQLKRIAKATSHYPGVELLTVDKSQGRDKKCVILSLTRSNDLLQAGDLMKDWQRLNVSITRAKVKLIFVGSVKTLGNSKSFDNLLDFLRKRGWIFKLPLDAHNLHQFHDPSSMPPPNHKLQTPKFSSNKRKPLIMSSELF